MFVIYSHRLAATVVALLGPTGFLEAGMRLWGRLAAFWRRRRGSPAGEEAPALRLAVAPQPPWPSWHPALAADGTPPLQTLIKLEASNRTDRDIRIDHDLQQ